MNYVRESVLECSSPLELFVGRGTFESARGLAHSRTLARGCGCMTQLLLHRLGCEEAADGLVGESEAGGGAEHAGEFV